MGVRGLADIDSRGWVVEFDNGNLAERIDGKGDAVCAPP